MSNFIKVSVQRLNQDRDTIQNDMKDISKSIKELYDEMQLLGQTWEGPAWQAFQNQVAEDIRNMQDIYEKLSVYLSHMEYAGKQYQQCRNQVGSLVDSIRI